MSLPSGRSLKECLTLETLADLEYELHFAEADAVAVVQGLERVGRYALAVDHAAVHGFEIFQVEVVAVARYAEVAA